MRLVKSCQSVRGFVELNMKWRATTSCCGGSAALVLSPIAFNLTFEKKVFWSLKTISCEAFLLKISAPSEIDKLFESSISCSEEGNAFNQCSTSDC